MKKLLAIIVAAVTLGAFADAGNTPMTFELPEGLAAGTQVTLVCNGEAVHTTTATSDSITYSTEGLAAGEYWLELAGEPITESVIIGTSASAPQFASAKYAEGDNELIIAEGTLESPVEKTAAELAGKAVTIKSGCALKIADVASGVNQVWTITGEGSDSYLVLASNVGYGFNNGSKFNNLTMVVEAGNVWLEDRETDVYGDTVNLLVKGGTVTFAPGGQSNPIVSFGTITKEGGNLARNSNLVVVAKSLSLGETAKPDYIIEGLLWNNSNNHWYEDTKTAAGTTITAEDTVVFHAFDSVLYNHCTTASKIVVSAGTLKIGHNDQGGNNLATGSVVTINQEATAELRCWDSNPCNTATVRFPGVTFNGPGSVVVNDNVQHISVGSLAGNAPLNIKSADIVLAQGGTLSYTGAISGSGAVPYFSGMSLASDWTGTVSLPEMDAIGGNVLDLNTIGNVNSKVAIARISSGWLKVGSPTTVNPTLILNGEFALDDYSQRVYIFTGIEGSGNFSLNKKDGANTPTSVTISTIDQAKYTGAIKSIVGRTLTIASLKTTLESLPSEKTKVLSIAEGTTDTVAVTAAILADGTAIDAEKISVEEDGIYVLGNAPVLPEAIEGGSEAQQTAYVAWAAEVGIDDPTVTGASEAFALSLTAEKISAAQSVENAVEKELDSLITADMVAELAAKAAEGETSVTIEGFENATFTFVPVEDIETTAKLFRLKVEFNAKGQN